MDQFSKILISILLSSSIGLSTSSLLSVIKEETEVSEVRGPQDNLLSDILNNSASSFDDGKIKISISNPNTILSASILNTKSNPYDLIDECTKALAQGIKLENGYVASPPASCQISLHNEKHPIVSVKRRTSLVDVSSVKEFSFKHDVRPKRNSLACEGDPSLNEISLNFSNSIFAKSDNLIKVIFNQLNKRDDYKLQLYECEKSVIKYNQVMQGELRKNAIDLECCEILTINNKNLLINRLTVEDVQLYGVISALMYDIKTDKSTQEHTSSKKLEKKNSYTTDTALNYLKLTRDEITKKINVLTKKDELLRMREDVVDKLRILTPLSINNTMTIHEILLKINTKICELKQDYSLNYTKKSDQIFSDPLLKTANDIFRTNNLASGIKIIHIFRRNGNEFSGIGGYDSENNKLILAFAGSKSVQDWWKNVMSSHHMLSPRHGLLAGVSIHDGIGSHLNDNFESFFEFIDSWLKSYQPNKMKSELEIVAIGHSLGGSLAEIYGVATKQVSEKYSINCKVGVITFGSPNIIAKTSLDRLTSYFNGPGNAVRFANENDIFTSYNQDTNISLATFTIKIKDDEIQSQTVLSPPNSPGLKKLGAIKLVHSSIKSKDEEIQSQTVLSPPNSPGLKKLGAIKSVHSSIKSKDEEIQSQTVLSPPNSPGLKRLGSVKSAHSSMNYYHNSAKSYNIWQKNLSDLKPLIIKYLIAKDELDSNKVNVTKIESNLEKLNEIFNDLNHDEQTFSLELDKYIDCKTTQLVNLTIDHKSRKKNNSNSGPIHTDNQSKLQEVEKLRQLADKIKAVEEDIDMLKKIKTIELNKIGANKFITGSLKSEEGQKQYVQLKLLLNRAEFNLDVLGLNNSGINLQ